MSFVQLVDLPDFGDVLPAWIAEATAEAPERRRRAESYADRPEDVVEAVRRLAAAQAAVQGAGGDHCTFVACCVGRDLSLSPEVFEPLLLTWNERCAPPWSAGELRTKMRNAYRYAEAAEPGQSSAATPLPRPHPGHPRYSGPAATPTGWALRRAGCTRRARDRRRRRAAARVAL